MGDESKKSEIVSMGQSVIMKIDEFLMSWTDNATGVISNPTRFGVSTRAKSLKTYLGRAIAEAGGVTPVPQPGPGQGNAEDWDNVTSTVDNPDDM